MVQTSNIPSFHTIQRRQRLRSYILLGFFCLLYFLIILSLIAAARSIMGILGVMRIEKPGFDHIVTTSHEPLLMFRHYLFSLLLGIAVIAIQLFVARRNAVRSMLDTMDACEPDTTDRYHVRFRNTVAEMAIACGRPDSISAVVMPTHTLAAFGVEDQTHGAVVGVSEGLLSQLSRDQMQASVAQVMAHIREGDTRLVSLMCAMLAPFIAVAEGMQHLSESDEHNRDSGDEQAGLMLLLVGNLFTIVATLMYLLMRLVSTVFSRQREILADANAVQYTRNPLALAQALHHINTKPHFMGALAGAYAPLFLTDPTSSLLSQKQNFLSNLFATHPPVNKRIETLLQMAHAGPEALYADSSLLEGSDLVTASGSTLAGDLMFLLKQDHRWTLPLPLPALVAHPSFRPDAWITPDGHFAPVRAAQNPLIAAAIAAQAAGAEPLELNAETKNTPQSPEPQEKSDPPMPAVDTASGLCPDCRSPLATEHYEGAQVHRCRKCEGILVGDAKIRRILSRREKAFDDTIYHKALEWKEANPVRQQSMLDTDPDHPFLCPDCGIEMTRRFYSYQYFIPVDRCFSCAQTWFEKHELETLQVLIESSGR